MKTFILCLYVTTTGAWRSGVYILDGITSNQYYNPLTQPHEQLDLNISFHSTPYRVAENFVTKATNPHPFVTQNATEHNAAVHVVDEKR